MNKASMALEEAIRKLERELPGWWWKVGHCSVSADATIGPDRNGCDAFLLKHKHFDEGFDCALAPPATVADALLNCIERAKCIRYSYLTIESASYWTDAILDGTLAVGFGGQDR